MASDHTVAVIVAAGQGARIGGAVPKQFARLGGMALLEHSWRALKAHPRVDRVLLVIGDGQASYLPAGLADDATPIGGATRRESVRNAIETLAGARRVLIHDAARPFVAGAVIDRLLDALETSDGAVPVLPVPDTLVRDDGETVARAGLHRVQTPQAFRLDRLLAAHRSWASDIEATDDAQMMRALGGFVALVQGDPMLEKLTYPDDFAVAEARIGYEFRSASGFDVHRLADGEELWLGGVLIPHTRGLSGHSDADVALHAITDALLGTIAAGDIGTHFPPSDPQWKGAASAQFLEHAATLVAERGGAVTFIDLTLICEAPKIGPHRTAIQACIADLLDLSTDRISVKATTTERLGFTGRGEGIAAQAIVTVRLPGAIA